MGSKKGSLIGNRFYFGPPPEGEPTYSSVDELVDGYNAGRAVYTDNYEQALFALMRLGKTYFQAHELLDSNK